MTKTKTQQTYNINKQYKKIKSLIFNNIYEDVKQKNENKKEPLSVSILAFDSPKNPLIPYNVDVSVVFNKLPKSVILKYWKKTKISKNFAHWMCAYKKSSHNEFYKVSQIPGANTSLYHFKLLINCSDRLTLSKTHLSSVITQVLCNQPVKKEKTGANIGRVSSVLGAFIIYKKRENSIKDNNLFVYFLSGSELQQCIATIPAQRQYLNQWDNYMGINKKKTLLHSLLGFSDFSFSGQGDLINNQLIRTCTQKNNVSEKNFAIVNTVTRFSTLAYIKHPLYKFILILQTKTVK